jgi:hypothetical protein
MAGVGMMIATVTVSSSYNERRAFLWRVPGFLSLQRTSDPVPLIGLHRAMSNPKSGRAGQRMLTLHADADLTIALLAVVTR